MPVAVGQEKLKVLIRRARIQKRVVEVARAITKDFKGERVHLGGVGLPRHRRIFVAGRKRHRS